MVSIRIAIFSSFLTSTALLTACGPELPLEERIASTRPLALRITVTNPLPILPPPSKPNAGLRCEALPFETVQLEPWIVDPQMPVALANIHPIWIVCELFPNQGLFACLQEAFPTRLEDLPTCPEEIQFPESGNDISELPPFPSPCRLPEKLNSDGYQQLTVPLSTNAILGGDLEITMIGQSPGGLSSEECAQSLLSGSPEVDPSCILMVQRLPIGPTEQLLQLASSFGFELPPEVSSNLDPAKIPDFDRNPSITRFDVMVMNMDDESTYDLGPVARGEIIEVKPGQVLKITTEVPEQQLQTYPVEVNNGADGTESRIETLSGSWFISWGELQSSSSNDPVSTNQWALVRGEQDEDELPPDRRATLYYVLRDNRQGVDWWWFHVLLTDSAS